MKKFLMAAAALALMGSVAFAGPNAGGTVIVHNASLGYTGPGTYCGLGTAPASCVGANTEISGNNNALWVWDVYAAFAPCSAPRLKAIDFGIQYGQFGAGGNIVLTDHGNCAGDPNNGAFESPGPGWPNTNSGTAIVFANTQTTTLVEAYWFAGYSYYGAVDMFTLTAGQYGGYFADDSTPPILDKETGYGSLGFNQPGSVACPTQAAEGACCASDGSCTLTCEGACTGVFKGPGTTCSPNPCSAPQGACCVGQTCYIVTQAQCQQMQGTYKGDNTTCSPNPCIPVPTKEESWGQIKHTYR